MDAPTLGHRPRQMVVDTQRERQQGSLAGREKERKRRRER